MNRTRHFIIVFLVQATILSSVYCNHSVSQIESEPEGIYIPDLVFVPKKPDFGGEACVTMFLNSLGCSIDQDYVFDRSGVDPVFGRGCTTVELVNAVNQLGIDPGPVWIKISRDQLDQNFSKEMENLQKDIADSIPWIVCLRNNEEEKFVLVVGYDLEKQQILYHDPGIREGKFQRIELNEFKTRWTLSANDNSDFFVKLRMTQPKHEITGTTSELFTDADYAQHIRKLRKTLPDGDFKIIVKKPFVVIGDENFATVEDRATSTVGWATKRLKDRYFSKDPIHILDVWLFKDKESYDKNALELFGRKPTTPFGYYSSFNRALVMNISTGGGTLVHEIVHPFIESNFENCPSWFNEGFASLYEQCGEKNGIIWGSTNWRLRGLQLAIQDDRVPSFEELCSTSREQFYDQDPGTNYSQARYLCYYLQEQDKLLEYYQTFRDNIDSDPTGLKSLKKVLGTDDLDQFKRDWQEYVLKLRF